MRSGVAAGFGFAAILAAAAVFYALRSNLLAPPSPPPSVSHPAAPAAAPPKPAAPPPQAGHPAGATAPRFDVVRISPDGSAVIAGRAAPGAKVTVFDNDKPIGTATADANGEWALVPDHPLPPGKGKLRLEARPPGAGTATASKQALAVTGPAAPSRPTAPARTASATPPEAVPAPAGRNPAAAGGTYVVKRGNSLWGIARGAYGAGIRYLGIYSANSGKIRNPNLIYPGQRFTLPKAPERAASPPPTHNPAAHNLPAHE